MHTENYRMDDGVNLDARATQFTKWGLLAGGSALALYGITRRSRSGLGLLAAGGLIAIQGARTAATPREFHAQSSFAINCSPADAYASWRNPDKLRLFMRRIESIRKIDDRRSEWVAIGPMGSRICWTSEIEEDRQDQLISWRTTRDSQFRMRGSVQFRPAAGGRGTIVTASTHYELPVGPLGRALAAIFGKAPEIALRENLRRFKALLEAGEIPTTEGQSHGPRSKLVTAMHSAYSEPRKPLEQREPQPAQPLAAKARA